MRSLCMFTAAIAVLVVSTAAQSGDSGFANLCGQWGAIDKCSTQGTHNDGTSHKQYLSMTGSVAGVIETKRLLFSDSACATLDVAIDSIGMWVDLGPLNSGQTLNERKLQVMISEFTVTPMTASYTSMLTTNCPCSGTWTLGVARELKLCPEALCDTTIFGSYAAADKGGFVIGLPAFTVGMYNGTGLGVNDGSFHLGKYSHIPSEGFKMAPESGSGGEGMVQFVAGGAVCDAPAMQDDFCGTYVQSCYPVLPTTDGAAVAQSYSAQFEFCGEQSTGSFSTASAGWFNRTVTVFNSGDCDGSEVARFTEAGTMAFGPAASTTEQSVGYERYAPSMYVQSFTDSFTADLNANCPCGGTWTNRKRRRLTQCVDAFGSSTCTITGVYENVAIGAMVYGTARRAQTGTNGDTDDALQLSPPSSDPTTATTATLDPSSVASQTLLRERDIPCPVSADGTDAYISMCGEYHRGCSAAPSGSFASSAVFTGYDFEEILVVTGDPGDGVDDGMLTYMREYFPADTGCSDSGKAKMELFVAEVGLYTQSDDNGIGNVRDGAMVQMLSVNVTAFSETWVGNLNNPTSGCPCHGSWTKGVWRALTSCSAETCPGRADLFGNGTLATPGYGRMRSAHNIVQRSNIMETEAEGISNGKYALENYPLKKRAECTIEESKNICGRYDGPCHKDGDSGLDNVKHYVQSFELPGYTGLIDDDYVYEKVEFGGDAACLTDPQYKIKHAGKVWLSHINPQIKKGEPLELHPSKYEVEIYSADAADKLNVICPCGGTWAVGVTRTITAACPAGTCIDHSWARGPLGNTKMYGNVRKVGQFLRMTMMSEDKTVGYATDFTKNDYAMITFDLEKSKACHGKGSDTGESNWTKGGQFSIVMFCMVLSYISLGISYTTLTRIKAGESTAEIRAASWRVAMPHRAHWANLWENVRAGVAFTFGLKHDSSYESV